jgi:hypothetical protein
MAEPVSLERILSDPELAGFVPRRIPTIPPMPIWVLETTGPDDAEQPRPGDIVVAGEPRDTDDLPRLEAMCSKACACALALPAGIDSSNAYEDIAVITYPSWISRHGAAALLARALWPFVAVDKYNESAPASTVANHTSTRRRVLAVSSSTEPEGIAAALAPYLPFGVDIRSLRETTTSERYLLMLIAEGVAPAEIRLSLRAAAGDNRLSIGASDSFLQGEPVGPYVGRAREALLLGTALFGGGHVSFYENLYLYKAFIDDGRPDILLSFSRDNLGLIREWDERHGSLLLSTLETFFELDRSFRKTAERLGIHRHTLKSRLEKIEEITACPVRGEGGMSYELILAYKHLSKVKL